MVVTIIEIGPFEDGEICKNFLEKFIRELEY